MNEQQLLDALEIVRNRLLNQVRTMKRIARAICGGQS